MLFLAKLIAARHGCVVVSSRELQHARDLLREATATDLQRLALIDECMTEIQRQRCEAERDGCVVANRIARRLTLHHTGVKP